MVVGFLGGGCIPSGDMYRIFTAMKKRIEELIGEGADEFVAKEASPVDTLFAATVKNLKEKYPHITMTVAVPREKDVLCNHLYDRAVCIPPENDGDSSIFEKCNRYIIKNAEVLIIYDCEGVAAIEETEKRIVYIKNTLQN